MPRLPLPRPFYGLRWLSRMLPPGRINFRHTHRGGGRGRRLRAGRRRRGRDLDLLDVAVVVEEEVEGAGGAGIGGVVEGQPATAVVLLLHVVLMQPVRVIVRAVQDVMG